MDCRGEAIWAKKENDPMSPVDKCLASLFIPSPSLAKVVGRQG